MKKFRPYLCWDVVASVFIITLAAYVIGLVINAFIMHLDPDGYVFPMGTMMGIFGMLIFLIFMNEGTMFLTYHLSMSMGCTRKKFYLRCAAEYYVVFLLNYLMLYLLYRLELVELAAAYPLCEMNGDFGVFFKPALFLIAPLVCMAMAMIIGSLAVILGKIAMFVMLVFWMAFCLNMDRIMDFIIDNPVLAGQGVAVRVGLFATILSMVLTVIGFLLVRKTEVKI